MADDFDDELYNVYNTVKEDSYGNTDIYGDDYKDALTGDEPQQESKEEPYDPSAATADPSPHRDDENKQQQQQQQYMGYSPQRQPQQPMMWGGFPPNMYQYAAYQRTLQQMANPYQMQQMFQRHFRQQQQQQQQQQQFQQQAGDEEGSRKPPPVASAANQDEGKMFIGGLNWETTDESLRQYFSQFGEVMDCVVMRDPSTGRSRGFGFLTMADHAAIDTIVSQDHYLDGKRIDPKRAIPREEQDKTEKIFVGGISPEVDEDEFRDFFTQFGKVIDATLMTDRDTGRPRGFGFITFEDSNGVEEALRRTDLAIKNKPIEVKKAMPKSKQMRQQQQGPFNQPFGGAGARGGYMPNTRYAGAANYGAQSRGNYGMGGMYPNMYGYGNYNMAAAYYGRGGGGSGGGNGNGYMGGNSYYGRGGGNGYDEGGDDDRDDQDSRREERRSKDRSSERTGTGGGALHASQARNQHHYRPY